jgi:hypothetical protein
MNDTSLIKKDMGATHAAIRKGLHFLAEHQLHHGEFCTYMGGHEDLKQWVVPDPITFSTAIIGTLLLPWKNDRLVRPMLDKAAGFLKYQIMRSGTWSFYTKWSPYFSMVPADTDDTACISFFLREMGVDFPDNRAMLLDNRHRNGLFYTWFTFRFQRSHHTGYWKLVLREFKRPYKMLLFWRKGEAAKNDVDTVVNANILYYLGREWFTRPIIGHLLRIIAENREGDCDKWYRNPLVVYYVIARNYARGIRELRPAAEAIRQRLLRMAKPDGRIGNLPADTALALTTLLWFGCRNPETDAAAAYILSCQNSNGSWARQAMAWAGPSTTIGWGSEEVSTAFCLEALALYRGMEADKTRTSLREMAGE